MPLMYSTDYSLGDDSIHNKSRKHFTINPHDLIVVCVRLCMKFQIAMLL